MKGNLNAKAHSDTVDNSVLSTCRTVRVCPFPVYDNAPMHKVSSIKKLFSHCSAEKLHRPADLIPIRHLWNKQERQQ